MPGFRLRHGPVAATSGRLGGENFVMRLPSTCAAATLVLFLPTSATLAQLMVPDSGPGDRVMLFSQVDGSLLDVNWITDIGAPFVFTTPKEALVVNNQIWVADQVADAVHRFDLSRNFLGSITTLPAGLPVSNLDNLRGMGFDGSTVYLTLFHSNTAVRGVVKIDPVTATSTEFLPISPTTNSLFDAEPFEGDLLISNSTTNNIERRKTGDLSLTSNFATGITFPQQVARMADNSVISTSTIAAAGVEGVYHHNPDGSLRRYINTEAIKASAGELVPRGAWLLDNGDYFVTTSIGVFTVRPTGPGPLQYTFSPVLTGVDAQYVNVVPEPAAVTVGAMLAGLALSRRRRA
jgi:hypothetical protein